MHDLIHDVAQSVSGKELSATSGRINENVRHFSIPIREYEKLTLSKTHIRSYIFLDGDFRRNVMVENSFVGSLISSCRYLRVLNLVGLQFQSLSDSIGTLVHLRYLDISHNERLEVLPRSTSKLYYLQTLKLMGCKNLQELPQELGELVKLRVLDISCCFKLKYMPRGMEKLTRLDRLSDLIVGREDSCVNRKEWFEGLEELKVLNGLKGKLRVRIKWPENDITGDYFEKGNLLRSKHHLTHIIINFELFGKRINDEEGMIGLMKDLHPPPYLKILEINNYNGTRMLDWAIPNLVKLEIQGCFNIKEWGRGRIVRSRGNNQVEQMQSEQVPCLPHLKSLIIDDCPELTWIPMCPKLELLDLRRRFNERLVIGEVGVGHASSSTSTQEVSNWGVPKFKQIHVSNVSWLNSLPVEAFQCLETLVILHDSEVEKLGEVGEVLRSCSSSLRRLQFWDCEKVRSVMGGGLEHLTALEVLLFYNCKNLKLEEEEEGDVNGIMPLSFQCPSLLPSLHTLILEELPNLENLPKWMQFLTALQSLKINYCENLKAMPKWMPKLTSLRNLLFIGCSESLERRCQGEDLPFIQHIPSIRFRDYY